MVGEQEGSVQILDAKNTNTQIKDLLTNPQADLKALESAADTLGSDIYTPSSVERYLAQKELETDGVHIAYDLVEHKEILHKIATKAWRLASEQTDLKEVWEQINYSLVNTGENGPFFIDFEELSARTGFNIRNIKNNREKEESALGLYYGKDIGIFTSGRVLWEMLFPKNHFDATSTLAVLAHELNHENNASRARLRAGRTGVWDWVRTYVIATNNDDITRRTTRIERDLNSVPSWEYVKELLSDQAMFEVGAAEATAGHTLKRLEGNDGYIVAQELYKAPENIQLMKDIESLSIQLSELGLRSGTLAPAITNVLINDFLEENPNNTQIKDFVTLDKIKGLLQEMVDHKLKADKIDIWNTQDSLQRFKLKSKIRSLIAQSAVRNAFIEYVDTNKSSDRSYHIHRDDFQDVNVQGREAKFEGKLINFDTYALPIANTNEIWSIETTRVDEDKNMQVSIVRQRYSNGRLESIPNSIQEIPDELYESVKKVLANTPGSNYNITYQVN